MSTWSESEQTEGSTVRVIGFAGNPIWSCGSGESQSQSHLLQDLNKKYFLLRLISVAHLTSFLNLHGSIETFRNVISELFL